TSRHGRQAGAMFPPVELLLPGQVSDHPRDGVDAADPARGVPAGDRLEPAPPLAAREAQLDRERMRHAQLRESVRCITAIPWSMSPAMASRNSCGSRSAI